MSSISPNPTNVGINQTKQFTTTGLTNPKWRVVSGGGTINQSGIYTAPNAVGNAVVTAGESFWQFYSQTHFTLNADDSLTKKTADPGYYEQMRSNASLNAVGDFFECTILTGYPYWLGLDKTGNVYGSDSRAVILCNPGFGITTWESFNGFHTQTYGETATLGSLIRFEIIAGGQIRIFRNGVTIYTSVNSFLNCDLRFVLDGTHSLDTVVKPPRIGGSGIANYNFAEAAISIVELPQITTNSPLPQGVANLPYNRQLSATGGSGGYNYSIIAGTLPSGLGLSSGGLISGTPTSAQSSGFTVRVIDSGGLTADKVFALTIDQGFNIDLYLTNDPYLQHIPKADLLAWHAANKTDSSAGLKLIDLSKNQRDLVQTSNYPVIQQNILNGFPAVYFDGTKNPLQFSGVLIAKHFFVVAAFDGASFTANLEALMSDLSVLALLVGGGAGSVTFFNLQYGANFSYRKSEVLYAENSQSAPMSGAFAVIELQFSSGIGLNGIQIGKDRQFASRLWKGWFAEDLIYSRILTDCERLKIYQYFAMKYRLWSKNSSGLNIFPFYANRSRTAERERQYYLSKPYSGNKKALVRGGLNRTFKCPFEIRTQQEFEAADAFHEQHYPLTKFAFRDARYYPPVERTVRFASPLNEEGSDVTFRFNYNFDLSED